MPERPPSSPRGGRSGRPARPRPAPSTAAGTAEAADHADAASEAPRPLPPPSSALGAAFAAALQGGPERAAAARPPLRSGAAALAGADAGRDRVDGYVDFLHAAPTPFHAVAGVVRRLQTAGFVERALGAPFDIEPGERAIVVHPDGRSVIALHIGERSPVETGYALVGAHTDSPDLRLRLNPVAQSAGTVLLTTQFHGGLIRRSWLDRPLALAGAVHQIVRLRNGQPAFHAITGQPIVTRRLVHLDAPIGVIPDIAIHLDREKNEKGPINPQGWLNAVLATGEGEPDRALSALSERLGVSLERLDGFDLHLVPWQRPVRAGIDRSLVVGPRHDDLAMVWSALEGMMTAVARVPNPLRTRVAAFFDAEETGSLTSSGAASSFLRDVLVRVARRHPATAAGQDPEQAFAHTFCISADMAHAWHPNHPELHDKQHAPRINQGVVVKANAADRYATSGETAATFVALCEAAGARVQDFVIRQDLVCGSTIGPITAAQLGVRTVDVGCPQWAMHSACETCGADDLAAMVDVLGAFYAGGA
ncbi:MAG: M18 family aminopeptidase [Myxococcales bacterium]|nr:M18 family aminopeptidase [Myxococcales bacterium]